MLGNIIMTEDQEERRKSKPDFNINKGFELMLRSASKKKENKSDPEEKKFQLGFGKLFRAFGFEFSFDFNLAMDFKKRRKGQTKR